jgi:cell division protein FtsL
MNTAVRVLANDRFQSPVPSILNFKKPKLVNLCLIIALVLSAFSVIYIKDLNRRLFIQYQGQQAIHDKLYEDWGKLLLDQSTWSTHSRVQKIAENRLNMAMPNPKEVVVLRQHKKPY